MLAALSKSNVVPLRWKHVAMGEKNGVHMTVYTSLRTTKLRTSTVLSLICWDISRNP